MSLRVLPRLRRIWWSVAWRAAARIWCRGLEVGGVAGLPDTPVVFAANHSSHADTVVLQLVLTRTEHHHALAAGAEDYFFRNRLIGAVATFLGVYPFPRSGEAGVIRSRALLACGHSLILYPQGTRDGGPFRPGVARVAGTRYPVVPITIEGTSDLLPKGALVPRRAGVRVRFGSPVWRRPGEDERAFATRLQAVVSGHGRHTAAA